MRLPRLHFVLLPVALWASVASANAAEQKVFLAHPTAVDGHTLRDDSGNVYRLFAVKAPSPGRHCVDVNGADYDCGEKARLTLEAYSSSVLSCLPVSADGDQRALRCTDFMGRDVGARMVKAGWALPDRTVSHQYIFEEMEAEAHRSGLWQGRFRSAL